MPPFDLFKKGLKEKYNLNYEDVKYNYRYCGGNKDRHYNYWKLVNKDKKLPKHESNCVCNHHIEENCYITNGDDILVLGNCCIKAFVIKCNRTCEICGDTHRNRTDNKCNLCRQKEKTKKCISCNKIIQARYRKCYSCYLED